MTDSLQASVVICTHNRSRSLADACRTVLDIEFPPEEWELIIVDNASSDDTLSVAREVEREHPGRVRVLEEPKIGLSQARNTGLLASRGRVVAFLDDDAMPGALWLSSLVEGLREPDVYCVGGEVRPIFQGNFPEWFTDQYLPYFAVWEKGAQVQDLRYNDYPRGANIAYRREAFERFGLFSTYLGRIGASLLSCEEIELCLRIERGGGKIRYVPNAEVQHVTSASRITKSWLGRRFSAQGRSEAIVDWRHAGFEGLRVGIRRLLQNARALFLSRARNETAATSLSCQRQTLFGYLRGALSSPLVVPRYRRDKFGKRPADWLPFV